MGKKYRIVENGLGEYILQSKRGFFYPWIYAGLCCSHNDALERKKRFEETDKRFEEHEKLGNKIVNIWD